MDEFRADTSTEVIEEILHFDLVPTGIRNSFTERLVAMPMEDAAAVGNPVAKLPQEA